MLQTRRKIEKFQSAGYTSVSFYRIQIQQAEVLFRSGDLRLWSMVLTHDNLKCSLSKEDPRWEKIDLSFRRPRFDDLKVAVSHLSIGRVYRDTKI